MQLRLRPGKARHQGLLGHSVQPGPDRGHRGPHRRRQDHHGEAADALLRRAARAPSCVGRPRRAGVHARGRCAACSAWCCRTRGCSAAPYCDNIRYGKLDATDEEVEAAPPRRAARTTSSRRCPSGYDFRDQRGRQQHQPGPEPAAHHRARHPGRPAACSSWTRPPAPWTRAPKMHIQRAMDNLMDGRTSLRHRPPAVHHPARPTSSW